MIFFYFDTFFTTACEKNPIYTYTSTWKIHVTSLKHVFSCGKFILILFFRKSRKKQYFQCLYFFPFGQQALLLNVGIYLTEGTKTSCVRKVQLSKNLTKLR